MHVLLLPASDDAAVRVGGSPASGLPIRSFDLRRTASIAANAIAARLTRGRRSLIVLAGARRPRLRMKEPDLEFTANAALAPGALLLFSLILPWTAVDAGHVSESGW